MSRRAIFRRPRVQTDLIDLWSYIATDDEAAADRLLEKIEATLKMLADHPEAGRARPELHADLRSFPVGNYIVFYRTVTDGIEVVRLLSGYLDIDRANFG